MGLTLDRCQLVQVAYFVLKIGHLDTVDIRSALTLELLPPTLLGGLPPGEGFYSFLLRELFFPERKACIESPTKSA